MNGAIILARTDSSRFPNKILKEIRGYTILEWCVKSLVEQKDFEVFIATTDRRIDDPIIDIATKLQIRYYRGETNNVAKRILSCAEAFNLKQFARVNGDSPFIRKEMLIEGFEKLHNSKFDFYTNLVPRRFPYGISVEIFKTSFYSQVYNYIKEINHQEHVTTYIYENIDRFNPILKSYQYGNDHDLRFVIDYPEDIKTFEFLIDKIGNRISDVSINELITLYKTKLK